MTEENRTEYTEPTLSLSLTRKINLGNYESADVFISISNVRAGMTVKDLGPLLQTGSLAYDELRKELNAQLAEARDNS